MVWVSELFIWPDHLGARQLPLLAVASSGKKEEKEEHVERKIRKREFIVIFSWQWAGGGQKTNRSVKILPDCLSGLWKYIPHSSRYWGINRFSNSADKKSDPPTLVVTTLVRLGGGGCAGAGSIKTLSLIIESVHRGTSRKSLRGAWRVLRCRLKSGQLRQVPRLSNAPPTPIHADRVDVEAVSDERLPAWDALNTPPDHKEFSVWSHRSHLSL